MPLLWGGLLLSLVRVNGGALFTDVGSSVIGAAAGYLILWAVYQVFKLVTGKEGMGYGDFKLLAALGAWLGWQALPLIILLSAATGAIVGISGVLLLGRSRPRADPLRPVPGRCRVADAAMGRGPGGSICANIPVKSVARLRAAR